MPNNHFNEKVKESLDVVEKQMNIQIFRLILDSDNNNDIITFDEDSLSLQLLRHVDDVRPNDTKLSIEDNRAKELRPLLPKALYCFDFNSVNTLLLAR